MAPVAFFAASILAIAGAIGVVSLANPFYNVLALVVHLISLAALFLLLRAEFVAAAQVIVYAGAVMVLYVFVVSYVGGGEEPVAASAGAGLRGAAVMFAGALAVELCVALLGTGLSAITHHGAPYSPGPQTYGTPAYIGKLLLTRFLLVFEIASYLLLIAAVGGVVLAARSTGAISDADRAPGDGPPPEGPIERMGIPLADLRSAGSMVEGVGRSA